MAVGIVDRQKLVNIADAVRKKKGITGGMTLDAIESNITSMPTASNNAKYDFTGSGSKSEGDLIGYLTTIDLSNFDTSNYTDIAGMFYEYISLTSLDLSNFNTSNVEMMDNMFSFCSSLTSLDLSGFDTSKVTRMDSMFSDCSSLTSLDLSNWNTSKVYVMASMFFGCSSLTSLDLSNFNTTNLQYIKGMFSDCSSLTSLDLSNWNTSKVEAMDDMFWNCSKLTNLTLGNDWASNSSISSFSLSSCPLTHESAVDVINKLATRSNSPVITFSNKVSLYQSEIDVATNKGWSVSGCTVLVDAETATVGQYIPIDGVLSRCVYVADTPQDWGQRIFISSLEATDSKGNTSFEWGENGFATGVTRQDIGNGLTNTNELIAMNLKPSGVKPTIWDAIKEFRNTHSDRWFIPSRNELEIIINNYTYSNIWSSTELNSTISYASNPDYSPNTITKDKTELYSVLPFTYV